jgi:hypothetical protein
MFGEEVRIAGLNGSGSFLGMVKIASMLDKCGHKRAGSFNREQIKVDTMTRKSGMGGMGR